MPGTLNTHANLFRGFGSSDQLSYAGISASAKLGQVGWVEPFTQKVATGSSVAFNNLRLAWPNRKSEIDAVLKSGAVGILNTQLMRDAGATHLINDSTRKKNWNPGVETGISQVSVAEYPTDSDTGQVSLWRIDS